MWKEYLDTHYGSSLLWPLLIIDLNPMVAGRADHRDWVMRTTTLLWDFSWLERAQPLYKYLCSWAHQSADTPTDLHKYAHLGVGRSHWQRAWGHLAHSTSHGPLPYCAAAIGELLMGAQLADWSPEVQAAPNPADEARRKAETHIAAFYGWADRD